jgi:hypothetical protein
MKAESDDDEDDGIRSEILPAIPNDHDSPVRPLQV